MSALGLAFLIAFVVLVWHMGGIVAFDTYVRALISDIHIPDISTLINELAPTSSVSQP